MYPGIYQRSALEDAVKGREFDVHQAMKIVDWEAGNDYRLRAIFLARFDAEGNIRATYREIRESLQVTQYRVRLDLDRAIRIIRRARINKQI